MCGIAGSVGRAQLGECVRTRMSQAIAHRGPEDEGFFDFACGPFQGLFVHRRLRIIDLSPGGHQPMVREGGQLAIVFNGEIYNYRELRRVLINDGHCFESSSDTEVILHAYRKWDADCVEHLHGMFAFALWDGRRRELLLARDRIGKKPLFYSCDGNQFLFGSEIKAIVPALDRAPALDHEALDDYLTYLYVPYPKTIFEGIRQLPPATRMRVKTCDGRLETETVTYWSPLPSHKQSRISVADARSMVQSALQEAVCSRLVSDVPLGVLLSGGIDSSTVTAIMAGASSEAVRSFSVGFEAQHYDESPYARMVADRFGCRHEVLTAQPGLSGHLAQCVWHFDQPFGNPTALLTYVLSAMTRRAVTVAVCGDGGDELFGGYPRYVGAYVSRLPHAMPRFVRNRVLPWIGDQISDESTGRHQFRRLREFLTGAGQSPIEMYLDWVGYFTSRQEKEALYTSETRRTIGEYDSRDFLRELYRQAESLEPLNRFAYVDIKSFLCCNVLEYSDRMSMAHALELRSPLTDHRLVELALALPFDMKFRYGETKWILKQAIGSFLPRAVLNKQKLGFNPPVAAWLQNDLRGATSELLSAKRIRRRGLLRPEAVESLLDAHFSGRRDFSLKIWALMVLEVWFQMYMEGRSPESVQADINDAVAGRAIPRAVPSRTMRNAG